MSVLAQTNSIDTLVANVVNHPDHAETILPAEMGIPTFLIGEDTTAAAMAPTTATLADSLGQRLTGLANALAARKPVLDDDDVAKLIKLLAKHNFLPPSEQASASPALARSTEQGLPAAAPPVLADIVNGMAHARAVRLVNFHATPRYREAEYRAQIAAYARDFEPITPANFALAINGNWPHERPGLLPALFEGYRDNLDVLLPILEEYGFTGWFFVPSEFLGVPAHEQRSYAAAHVLHLPEHDEYPDDRIALTWDEAREIARRGHAFACHTRTHNMVTADTPHAELQNEIAVAKAEMEAELGVTIEIFCWLEGAALGVNPAADAMLRDVGFRYLLSNFKIQKLV